MAGYLLEDYAAFCLRKENAGMGQEEYAAMLMTQTGRKVLAACEKALVISTVSIPEKIQDQLTEILNRYPTVPRRNALLAEYLYNHHAGEQALGRLYDLSAAGGARSAVRYLEDVGAGRVARL